MIKRDNRFSRIVAVFNITESDETSRVMQLLDGTRRRRASFECWDDVIMSCLCDNKNDIVLEKKQLRLLLASMVSV